MIPHRQWLAPVLFVLAGMFAVAAPAIAGLRNDSYGTLGTATLPLVVSGVSTGLPVTGSDVDGTAAGTDVLTVGGVDGSGNAQQFATDTSGRQIAVGAVAEGSATSGAPVLAGGKDPSGNVIRLLLDAVGRTPVTGPFPDGQAATGTNPFVGAGVDGSGNIQAWNSTTTGEQIVVPTTFAVGQALATVRNLAGTVTAIKAGAGELHSILILNDQAALKTYVQVFNVAAGSVTLGTTVPDMEFLVPAQTQVNVTLHTTGARFSSAISVAATTAEYGNTGSAAGVHVFAQYR